MRNLNLQDHICGSPTHEYSHAFSVGSSWRYTPMIVCVYQVIKRQFNSSRTTYTAVVGSIQPKSRNTARETPTAQKVGPRNQKPRVSTKAFPCMFHTEYTPCNEHIHNPPSFHRSSSNPLFTSCPIASRPLSIGLHRQATTRRTSSACRHYEPAQDEPHRSQSPRTETRTSRHTQS